MKKVLLALALGLAVTGGAQAVTTDSVMLLVTPVFNLSVNISSTTNQFGTLALKTSATICVGNISNDGNVTAAWQKMAGNAIGGAHPWTLVTTGTPGSDRFRLLAVTTGTTASPSFVGTMGASCIISDHQITGVTNSLSDLTEGATTGPNHPTGETRNLWVSIMMPTDVTGGQEQTITLSIQAVVK